MSKKYGMSTYNKELSNDQEIDTVVGVKFSVLSPDEITRRSVVEVTKNDTFTGSEPVVGGLFDPRMGVLETNRTCATCQQKNLFCPGHFGHINLARPIYHPMFFDITRKLLKCVCYRCSRPLISARSTKDDIKAEVQRISSIANQHKRWDNLMKLHTKVKIKRCGDDMKSGDGNDGERNTGCQALQPSRYQKELSGLNIIAEWKEAGNESTKRELTAEDVLRIFRRITEQDMKLMGFDPRWNRPEWMICTVLPVPPPSVRPSIIEESGQRREDDLTHKLCEIIKFNTQLKQRIETGKATEENIKLLTNIIQYHVSTFMDNQIPGMAPAQQRNGRKLKSIADRWNKKEGRIRGNLNGKRVDQSARSVITPDPYVSLEELGVPLRIAMNLTFPEVVNRYNIDFLRGLVRAGVNTWPGAKYVRRASDGVTIALKYANREKIAEELTFGDTVDRHMLNGDYVLFNRQPSLHKMSMMGFKIRVMTYQTFRLPVLSTGCFNADFDGDEMNLFKSQNVQTMSEIMDIARITYLIINPRDAKPIVEVIQDTMVGSYRITKDWTYISDKTMANLQMVNSYFNGKLPSPDGEEYAKEAFSGKQAFSMMLPPGLYVSMKNKADELFKIEDGKITSGTVDKSVYHSMSKGIIPILFHDYNPFEAKRFLDNTQRLMCRWLTIGGFSVGISDIVVDPKITEKIKSTISEYKKKAYEKFMDARKGTFENASILNNEDNFEREILNVLNALNKELGRVKLDERSNRMINMIKSGSKGKEENVAQMVAAVGQQNVDGKRVSYGFTDRTLPHYTKYDDGPEARGFVENSFINGLSPQEVFFHAMGGREGLIDTAVKSVTGDTPLIILEDGVPRYVRIGDWIDAYLDKYPEEVKHHKERQLELLYIDNKHPQKVFIPTSDYNGNVSWGEVTAVTRHDPGNELYEIKTSGGKRVIVTECKSLLVWNEELEEFREVPTPNIKVGDYVPSTANLCSPPITTDYVDMSKYFPKTKYVHGTDFHMAVTMMKKAQGQHFHIPHGWWNDNNKKAFTLPFTSKARLMRALTRTKHSNILPGHIYPFHATRNHALIPDKLELTEDTGKFIGLFLAEGHASVKSGTVSITNIDTQVLTFVKSWFDTFHVKHEVVSTVNKIGGTSTSIVGYSTLLASFLDRFVGHGAANKHVPDVAFVANEEFIVGLLSGYFSGDGTVSKTSVEAGSASARLTEGVSMLCTRLGIFGKVFTTQTKSNNLGTKNIAPSNRIAIRAQWAHAFAEKVELIHPRKQAALQVMKCSNAHRNFKELNDVVLDKIEEINVLGVHKYPKVYDITVPSTLNFGLANGLQVRDTSETGYIQRRLVKAMEDAKVYYDQTVRNATGALVQYLYGEDGMDGTKIEKQFIPYIEMNTIEMDNLYHLRPEDPMHLYLTDDAMKKLKDNGSGSSSGSWYARCKNHFQQLLDDRLYLIQEVFKGKKNNKIQYPIPFERIISNAVQRLGKAAKAPTDLTPTYILDKIDELIDNLKVIRKNQGIKFLHVLLRLHLSPKPMIFRHTMSRPMFDWVISEIERHFVEAVVQPAEMIGVIAAQSIGELSTQQSVVGDSQVIVSTNGKIFKGRVGDFIDSLITEHSKDVVYLDHSGVTGDTRVTGSCVLRLPKDTEFKIVGISQDEKVAWNTISEVSRHPANGGVMKITTRSGKSTTATLSHSFLKRGKHGIVAVLGSELKVGDRIPVARSIPTIDNPMQTITIGKQEYKLDKNFGWICGAYLADGSLGAGTVAITKFEPVFEERIRAFAKEYNSTVYTTVTSKVVDEAMEGFQPGKEYTSKSTVIVNMPLQKWIESMFSKGVPAFVYMSNLEFIAGVISGYFDGDGSFNASKQCMRAHSVNEGLIDDIIILLAYHGIFASKLKQDRPREKASRVWEVTINKKYAHQFQSRIGVYTPHKANALNETVHRIEKMTRHADYIDAIPELGETLDFLGKALEMPGQSRTYATYLRHNKPIGRDALAKHIIILQAEAEKKGMISRLEVQNALNLLKQAASSGAVYDSIVSIEYLDDPKTYVYDFTVPGNESFMVDTCVLVHNTLDSFHSSGTAAAVKATSGVPRLKELLNVSKNIKTPTMFIYMQPDISTVINPAEDEKGATKDPRVQEAKERSMRVKRQLEVTRIIDILDSTEVYWDPPGADGLSTEIPEDQGMLEVYRTFALLDPQACRSNSPWVLRIKINKEKLFKIGLTMMDVYMRLHTAYQHQIDCVFSDDNATELIFRVRLKPEALKDVDVDDVIAALKAMEYNLVNSVLLKGVKAIKKVAMRPLTTQVYNEETDQFDTRTEWVLDTDGTNLQDIFANPNVDASRTRSNDVYEILNTLGIEAARNVLHQEFMEVVGEDALNYRHMSLLLDTMTNRGTLMSVDRHGINRGDIGPLAKSSFEETTDMLIEASIFSQYDKINGVSANIMLGQVPPCGTADHNIFIDEEEYIRLLKEYKTSSNAPPSSEIVPIHRQIEDPCTASALAFDLKLPEKGQEGRVVDMQTPTLVFK